MSQTMMERWSESLDARRTIELFWEWLVCQHHNDATLNDMDIGKLLDEFHQINRVTLDDERRALLRTSRGHDEP